MLSVIILCGQTSPPTLVRTLAPLVEASVRGLLRDVILAGPSNRDYALVADYAGCTSVEAPGEGEGLAKAAALARGSDLLILYEGYVPEPGFFEEVEDLLQEGGSTLAASYVLREMARSFLYELFPRLSPIVGLLVPRRIFTTKPASSLRDLRIIARARRTLSHRLQRVS